MRQQPPHPTPLIDPDPALFLGEIRVRSKAELFSAICSALVHRGLVLHEEALLQVLLEREALGTSAVGDGIALPHVRAHVIGATALGFARLRPALDFEAVDGRPVEAVVFLVAPYDLRGALYQRLLAVLAELAHREAGRRQVLEIRELADFARLVRQTIWPRLLEVLSR